MLSFIFKKRQIYGSTKYDILRFTTNVYYPVINIIILFHNYKLPYSCSKSKFIFTTNIDFPIIYIL